LEEMGKKKVYEGLTLNKERGEGGEVVEAVWGKS